MSLTASRPPLRTRRWSRHGYDRLIEVGIFRPDERLELIDGELLAREPQRSPHATAISLVAGALRAAFGWGWHVRAQLPVALDDTSEPEPDVAVVRGSPRDYRDAHPSRPVLIVEVADTTLAFDRGRNASLHARAGIGDYWIVNLIGRVLEVRREPVAAPSAPLGWKYRSLRMLGPAASVSPLAAPPTRIPVTALLP